jgi:hypothetical protein
MEPEVTTDAKQAEDEVRQVKSPTEPEKEDARVFADEVGAVKSSESEEAPPTSANDHHGKAGLIWGAAGLGLAIYALADPERREKFLKLANESTVLAQELLRDLQGYDDEFA